MTTSDNESPMSATVGRAASSSACALAAMSLAAGGALAQARQGTSAGQTAAGEACVYRPATLRRGPGSAGRPTKSCAAKTGVLSATLYQMAGTTGADGLRALASTGPLEGDP